MKVLVANRGEIACRVLRTLQEMGVPSVAVHSDVDADAPHVWLADEAVALGGPSSYLDVPAILAAARSSGATAVHPGYGFLSQNAGFVRVCQEAGLTFIGPAPGPMAELGDKRASRAVAERSGVPVIPGAKECDTVEAARRAADHVGYPILLKAAGGGGGKGMRLVESPGELAEAFEGARREAKGAFSDDRMLVEKYIYPARHVEVQILADGQRAVALGERECSLQRRYQKIIEESPCAAIDERTRQGLFESAVRLAEAVGYANAGTVEFLVGPDGDHYFLEVNTRLQVEHPVTEMCIGMDLVAAQIEVAHGGALPAAQRPRGHAIEARLNAEDPYSGFLPATGEVLMLQWPQRPGVRVDAGIREGSVVSPHYDSLLAKVIAWGQTREQARQRLMAALRDTVVLGLATNQAFLLQLLDSSFFVEGETYTTTVEQHTWTAPEQPGYVQEAAKKASAMHTGGPRAAGAGHGMSDIYSPWETLGAFRMGA